jgi:hypothetical protein
MSKISILLVAILLWATPQLTAQMFPTSNLTIFSEDGHRFFLILNGVRQNEVAQTNVRIEELPQPYYNCKIIFEDKALNEISKNALMLTDADGIHQDVTYKIKADNKGKQVLRWQSFVPAQQNMIRPSNCTVYRFGNPNQVIFGPGMVETQTTTVVTERNRGNVGGGLNMNVGGAGVGLNMNIGDGGVGVNMNVGGSGVGLNVQFDDPQTNMQQTTTTTRTTTTTTTRPNQQVYYDEPAQVVQGCANTFAMNARDFESAKQTIKNENFDETRLDLAKQIASSNCLNTNQIIDICRLITFEASKLEFAKFGYEHCVDPRNYFKVANSFTFSSSKQELNSYIQGR